MKKLSLSLLLLLLGILTACDTPINPNPDITPEPTINEDYLRLFDDDNEKSFTLEVSSTEFYKLDQYMIEYRNQFGDLKTDAVVQGKLIYRDELGELEVDKVAWRTRGNTSRTRMIDNDGNLRPVSYKIYFDKALYVEKDSVEEKNIKNRRIFDMTELNFKFNRNEDSTYISEKFSYDLFNAFDVFAPRVTHAKMYLKIGNTTHFLGIYNVIESIDQSFLTKRFPNEDQGNLYKVLWQQFGPASLELGYDPRAIGIKDEENHYFPSYDLKTNKKAFDTSDIVTFIQMINTLDGDYFKTYIEANFDVDRLLRLLAVGVMLGNPDDYRAMGNNYYLYKNNVSGLWSMIPYDYDHGLGQGWDGAPVFTNYSIGMDIYRWGNLNTAFVGREVAHPLTDKLLLIPEYQLRYESYLKELVEGEYFNQENFLDAYLSVKTLYEDDIPNAKWGPSLGLRNIEWYISSKRNDVLNQLSYYENNPNKRPK
jgi:hypothetical protein